MDSAPKRRVLLLDDDVAALESARLALAAHFEVEATHSPIQALQKLRESDFWVICSAQRMPGLTGVELYERVRDGGSISAFVLLTPSGESAPAELGSGEMVSVLEKPVEPARLVRLVEQLSRLVQMRRNIAAVARPGSRATVMVAARPPTQSSSAVPISRPPNKSNPGEKP